MKRLLEQGDLGNKTYINPSRKKKHFIVFFRLKDDFKCLLHPNIQTKGIPGVMVSSSHFSSVPSGSHPEVCLLTGYLRSRREQRM